MLPNTAPMKCPRGPVPWEVARGIGEAVTDQEMACLLFAQELSGISKSGTSTSGTLAVFCAKISGVRRPIGWY